MNYKKLNEWNSGFHDWVLNRHPSKNNKQNGFMGGFIYGSKGAGKSTYCYKVMAKIYYTINGYNTFDDEIDAYNEALRYMYMDGDLYLDRLIENRIKEIVTPCICLDDAGRHFGTQLYKHNPVLYDDMAGSMQVVRDVVTGFLINAPKRSMCAKFLRENDEYKGEALSDSGSRWMRRIRFYEWYEYPDEVKRKLQIPFQDRFSCYIPDEKTVGFPAFENYMEKRRYFNIKSDIEMADKHKKRNRPVFLRLLDECPDRIPKDFHDKIKKWDK